MIPLLLLGCSAPGPFDCEARRPQLKTFNELWLAFDERYAVFDQRLPDRTWDDVGDAYCSELTGDMGDPELFEVLVDMVRELDDGHVQVRLPREGLSASGWANPYPHYPALYDLEFQAEADYLDGPLTWAGNRWVSWGRIDSVGYLSLTSMDSLSASGNAAADRRVALEALEQASVDLQGVDGLIVDVRANEGGWDDVSLAIAGRFATTKTPVWDKRHREDGTFGSWTEISVEPIAPHWDVPVVVLTSGGTFSAAETFVLAMRELDGVTVLGEPTSGHLSDIYGNPLSRGWRLSLSAEQYRAADGEFYEAVGVPPDVSIPFEPGLGRGVMLEQALDRLR